MGVPYIAWDLIKAADIKNNLGTTVVKRGLTVHDMPMVIDPTYGTDPSYLMRCYGVNGFPQLWEQFPNPLYKALVVTNRDLLEVVSKSSVRFQITYQGTIVAGTSPPTQPEWTITDGFTSSFITTYASSGGSKALTTWYKKGAGSAGPPFAGPNNTTLDHPTGSQMKAGKATKLVSHRSIKATQIMTRDKWDAQKFQLRYMAEAINSDSWNGERGEWYFVGPHTVTKSLGNQVLVECVFLYMRGGWYPFLPWFTITGEHPSDSVTEGFLRGVGKPANDDIIMRNGLTMASVQAETPFNPTFSAISNI